MGNSMNVLSSCLPQQNNPEDEDLDDEEEGHGIGRFVAVSNTTVDSAQVTSTLLPKKGMSLSRASSNPSSSVKTTSSSVTSEQEEASEVWEDFDDQEEPEAQQIESNSQTISKTATVNNSNLLKKSSSTTTTTASTAAASTSTPTTPTAEIDFFDDMAVNYKPAKKIERVEKSERLTLDQSEVEASMLSWDNDDIPELTEKREQQTPSKKPSTRKERLSAVKVNASFDDEQFD